MGGGEGEGEAELFTCPYPLKVHARPPRDQRVATQSMFSGQYFQLSARDVLHAPCHIQDSTYDNLCDTHHGALAGMRNSSVGPP